MQQVTGRHVRKEVKVTEGATAGREAGNHEKGGQNDEE